MSAVPFSYSTSRLSWLQGQLARLGSLPVALLRLACGGLVGLTASGTIFAADPGSGAARYVTQALQAEADGDLVARDRLLTLAAQTDGDCQTAQWQRGCLKSGTSQWQSIEDCLAVGEADSGLDAYEARRLITLDNAAGQWQLTLWCLQNRYPDQARAHARRTLELETDHEAARRLLGFRMLEGQWVSAAEWNEFQRRAADVRRGLNKYGRQLAEIARGLRAHDGKAKASAREQLLSISEPIAIAPVEAILGPLSPETAGAAVDWLARIRDPDASRALVRFAMFHPEPQTRELAIARLKGRPYHDYVPQLLQLLSSPIAAMSLPVVGRDGTLQGFRQAFVQEKQGQTELFVVDTRMSYLSGAPRAAAGSQNDDELPADLMTQLEAYGRAGQQVAENGSVLRVNNERIAARNRRIAAVMSDITEREFSGTPSELWQWWDAMNETEYQSMKLSNVRYASTELATRNYTELTAAAMGGTTFSHECFARGTAVITRRGSRPIEAVRVGDLVLSRDVPTGELSWKPVVRATTRPPRPTYEITLDDESLRCTGGHLFWVSGKGWTKASELRGGDVLHGAASPAVVMKVVQHPEETTYNLAVEATQTYFVGKQMVLSHDVTDRVPTYVKVPGLSPVAAQ